MKNARNRQPVLMMHGVLGSSWDLTISGPGYVQADGSIKGKAIPF